MSDPTQQDIGWGKIIAINLQFALGALILCLGWLCWQNVSLEWWGLWLMAVLCFAGGAAQVIAASGETLKIILRLRRWKKYQQQGVKPRADQMPRDTDFDNGGFGS